MIGVLICLFLAIASFSASALNALLSIQSNSGYVGGQYNVTLFLASCGSLNLIWVWETPPRPCELFWLPNLTSDIRLKFSRAAAFRENQICFHASKKVYSPRQQLKWKAFHYKIKSYTVAACLAIQTDGDGGRFQFQCSRGSLARLAPETKRLR